MRTNGVLASQQMNSASSTGTPSLVALVALWAPMAVLAQQAGDFTYTNTGNAITITHYSGTNAEVSVPSAINGSPVISIGNWAFFTCTTLASVSIPESVTNIGDYAFDGCSRLARLIIPNSVSGVGIGAFEECHALTNVELSTSLTIISASAFQSCYRLAAVSIPSSVTAIWSYAFSGCSNLAGLILPGSVAGIGGFAFDGCTSLTNVTIPGSVNLITGNPFPHCTSLAAIMVDGANLFYSASDGVLFDKSQATLIAAPGGKDGSYAVPDAVTAIGEAAFSGCSRLTRVNVPSSVTNILLLAFSDCTSLTNVTISAGVASVGNGAFSGCINLASVLFLGNAPGTTPADNNRVFDGDTNTTVYYLPGTSGWKPTFGNRPASLWNPTSVALRAQPNAFAFDITGTTNIPVQIEASTDLMSGGWVLLKTGTLTNGRLHFSDPAWTNYPLRFYRIGFP